MLKQVLVTVISSIISYLFTDYILRKNYRRFYFINGIVKYPLKCTIKNAMYLPFKELTDKTNFIFYSKQPLNCENYIYDKQADYYYIIEPGYYYYINDPEKFVLNGNDNSFIYYLKVK
jgi:hypothetical protein